MHTEFHLGITSKLVSMSSLYNCISFLTKSRFLLDQLPYSSDLASDDFWLCSRIRFTLKVERVALLKPCKKCDLDSQELKKFQIYFCIEKKWGWKEVNNALILAGKWFSLTDALKGSQGPSEAARLHSESHRHRRQCNGGNTGNWKLRFCNLLAWSLRSCTQKLIIQWTVRDQLIFVKVCKS